MDAKSLYDGIGRLLATSSSRGLQRQPLNSTKEEKSITENGNLPTVENGVTADVEQTEVATNGDEEQKVPILITDEQQGE